MSWSIERSDPRPGGEKSPYDLVFRGFEDGIAPSAEMGIADMRNVNTISASKEAMVNFKMASVGVPVAVTATSCSFTGATDIVTCAVVAADAYNGMAVTFGSTSGGVTAGQAYYIGDLTATTFKIYDHISRAGSAVDLSDDSNTCTVYTVGPMKHHAESFISNTGITPNILPRNFFLDGNGRTWWVNASNNLIWLGNPSLTNAEGNGLSCIGSAAAAAGWLLTFRRERIDAFAIDGLTNTDPVADNWQVDWQTIGGYQDVSHMAYEAATFNGVIFCNVSNVGTIRVRGGTSFDPTNSATYDFDADALLLPSQDRTTWIAELNNMFLIGGIQTRVYTWDGNIDLYNFLILPEANVQKIVATNSNGYIFAGNRGRIYITNGSNVELFKKFPDQIAGVPDPYWTWGGALYWRNQLYFGLQDTTNAGVAINNTGGVWAIDLETLALRHTNDVFLGATASIPVIAPNVTASLPGGSGLYAASTNAAGTAWALDVSTTTPYIFGETRIDTDLANVGNFLTSRNFQQVEYKLSRPLVTGESVAISWRTALTGSFTALTANSDQTGALSGIFVSSIDPAQYLQFRIVLTSTNTNPSYCRLTEVRLR